VAVARRQKGARVAPLGEESHVSRVGDGDGAGMAWRCESVMEGRSPPRMVLMGRWSSAVGFSISLTRRIVGYGCRRFEFPAEHRCRRHTYERAGGWMDDGRKLPGRRDRHFLLYISRDL
jgi:hypothetical protein